MEEIPPVEGLTEVCWGRNHLGPGFRLLPHSDGASLLAWPFELVECLVLASAFDTWPSPRRMGVIESHYARERTSGQVEPVQLERPGEYRNPKQLAPISLAVVPPNRPPSRSRRHPEVVSEATTEVMTRENHRLILLVVPCPHVVRYWSSCLQGLSLAAVVR